ncbi:MAG: hypothetical protein H8D67_19970 [Deltaproteobacteria bacterium]|nr:hypothetical protein [Deltaproteobacteria bacterium]MBL7135852.1 hypothetical protein [Candidatus Neomarinimicrobiota bacterium]
MNYSNYDFEGLWFDIYRKVLRHNETLGDSGLDKSQLKEVVTSIFIAQSQRGVVRPLKLNGFTESVMKIVSEIKDRSTQEKVYKSINDIIKTTKSKGG